MFALCTLLHTVDSIGRDSDDVLPTPLPPRGYVPSTTNAVQVKGIAGYLTRTHTHPQTHKLYKIEKNIPKHTSRTQSIGIKGGFNLVGRPQCAFARQPVVCLRGSSCSPPHWSCWSGCPALKCRGMHRRREGRCSLPHCH